MEKRLNQVFDQVEMLLKNREYLDAERTILEIDYNGIDSDKDKSQYHYLWAWIHRGMGKFKRGLEEIDKSLEMSKDESDLILAERKYLRGRLLLGRGNINDALTEFRRAEAAWERSEKTDKYWEAFESIAQAYYFKGDLREALDFLNNASKAAAQYNTPAEVFFCESNKTRILLFMGRFDESESILLRYISADDLDRPNQAFIKQSLGILYVFRLNYEKASDHLLQAQDLYIELRMPREEIVCSEYLGLNEYFAGNYEKAKEYYTAILAQQEPTLHASAKAQTLRLLTDAHIALGEYDKAENTASKAIEIIAKINEQIELGAIYRAYGQIHAYTGDKNAALEAFDRSNAILDVTGARYEHALTHLARGMSEIYDRDTRHHYLNKAQEYFMDMKIGLWLSRIRKLRGAAAADHMRNKYWPSGEIPVNPFDIAESIGIDVCMIETEKNVAGGLWKRKGRKSVVFLNEKDPLDRQKFTLAHELGHHDLRSLDTVEKEFEITDYKYEPSVGDIEDEDEIYADQFAASLLMPERETRNKYTELKIEHNDDMKKIISSLSNHFSVSPEAVDIRLHLLGMRQIS